MAPGLPQAELPHGGPHCLEAPALPLEEGMIGTLRRREVGVDGIDPERSGVAHPERGQGPPQVVVAEAEPVHSRVDLDVHPEAASARRRRGAEPARGRGRRDGRRQPVSEHPVEVAHAERSEYEDRGPDARLAQLDALLDVGAGEGGGAALRLGRLQGAGDRDRAMTVRVGLDDGDDARRRPRGGRGQVLPDGAIVGHQSRKVDDGVRGTYHGGNAAAPTAGRGPAGRTGSAA